MESPLTPGPPTAIPSLNPRSKIGPTRIRAVAGVVVALVVATSFSLDWARAGVATLASAPVASMLAASTPTWQPVGTPGAVFTNYPGFSGTGWPGYSGRVQSIAADPTHPKTLYAGMAGGGVEKTVDGGETWTTLTDALTTQQTGALAITPDGSQVYDFTGFGGWYDFTGNGLWSSANGGAWNRQDASLFSHSWSDNSLIVDPITPSTLYAGVLSQPQPDTAFATKQGFFRWVNATTGWTPMLTDSRAACTSGGSPVADAANALTAVVEQGKTVLYAAVGCVGNTTPAQGLWTSADGGQNWTPITAFAGVNVITVAVTAKYPGRLVVETATPGGGFGYSLGGVWLSNDHGVSWVNTAPDPTGTFNSYNVINFPESHSIAIDPISGTPYIGLADQFGAIFRATYAPGSNSWSWAGTGGSFVHADIRSMIFGPDDTLYAGTDGGLFATTDGGYNWTVRNGTHVGPSGLDGVETYSIAVTNSNPAVIIRANQDLFTQRAAGPGPWNEGGTFGGGGDAWGVVFDPSSPPGSAVAYVAGSDSNISKSTDGGQTWNKIQPNWGTNWGSEPFATDPLIPNRLLAVSNTPITDGSGNITGYTGPSRIWDSRDGGATGTFLTNPFASDTANILKIAPSDSKTIYVSDQYAGVASSHDTGATWTLGSQLPNRPVGGIAISPTNPLTAWVSVLGYDESTPTMPGHVFKTVDGGKTWSPLSSGLPDFSANSIVTDAAGNLYVGTNQGVWTLSAGTSSWTALGAGLPNALIRQVVVSNGTLYAATFGRGVWSLPLSVAQGWAQQHPAVSPPARNDAGMAYDPIRNQTVLFGGSSSSGSALGDTWVWDGTTWTRKTPATSPPARYGIANAMVWDPALGKVVLFGGHGSSNLADTWTWDGTNWSQVTGTSPSAREHHSMAYDAATSSVVLFGGYGSSNLNDTWTLSGTTWSQKTPTTSPSARDYAFSDYDPQLAKVVMFGGYTSTYLNETWAWDGSKWTQLTPSSPPSARRAAPLAYDGATQKLVLFGGYNGSALNDSWSFDGTSWVNLSPTAPPSIRYNAAAAYGQGGQLTLFGGSDGTTKNAETWEFGGSSAPLANPPTAPTGVSAAVSSTIGPGQAVVNWTTPASNGGSPITGYLVYSQPNNVYAWVFAPANSVTIYGLTSGTAYTFTVMASNEFGTGSASSPTNSVTPIGSPSRPTGVSATAGNAQATVTWAPPAINGGSAVTGFTVTSSPGNLSVTAGPGATSAVLSGLTNGSAYSFTVTATNSIGVGPPSAPSDPVTPSGAATVPGAPTAVSATPGNGQANVSWTAPASDGGSPLTGYTITGSGGSTTPAGPSATSVAVTGLTNGTPYTFTVTATNAVGSGPASAASSSVTPAAAPGAPTAVSATAGVGAATVSWTAPNNNGSPITSYTVLSSPDSISATGTGSPLTVTGLRYGIAYTFTVTATNAVGTGPASGPSNSVTPFDVVPGAPTNVTATAGNASASVHWTAPAPNGGSSVIGYTVTSNPGNLSVATGPSTTTATVTGLTNGVTYTFTVTATNGAGTGAASAASNPVTPTGATAPGAPTGVTATAGNAQASVTWTAPTSNGGATITGYTVTSTPGGLSATTTGATSATVTGLTNGTSYTFTVTATNSVGTGPASAASNAVTPSGSATISNLIVGDTANAANWSIQNNLQVGNVEYNDRTYTMTSIPTTLLGAQWIKPAMASKTSTANPLVTFTISASMTIHVAVDTRLGKRPWMDSTWTDSATQIVDSESTPTHYEIFQKTFAAGQVTLGPNVGSGSSYAQYLVIAK